MGDTVIRLIAEVGVNYRDIEHAEKMIENAKDAGADYVKFQMFSKDTISKSPIKETLRDYILTEDDVKRLKEKTKEQSIGFIITPMYLDAVDVVAKYADLIKIRFADHENEALINKAMATGKKLLVSVPKMPLNAYSAQVQYLYCVPKYPPEVEEFNLDKAATCNGFSSHFPHAICDLAWAINRNFKDAWLEKHVFDKTSDSNAIDFNVSIDFRKLMILREELDLVERIQRFRIEGWG